MRPRIWTALFAVAISIVSIDQPLSAGAASPMVDPSSSGFTFTDLGPSIWPMHVNNSAVAVGQYVVNGNGQNPAPAMWRNGAVTQLAVPAGSHGSAVVITDAGVAEGGVYNPDTGTSAVVAWPVSGGAASTIATHYGALMGDPTTGTLAVIDSDTGQYSIMSADGRLLQAVGTPHYGPYLEGVGPTTFAWIDHETEQCVLEQTATGARTILDFCAAGIAPDGTVVGATSDSAQAGVLRLPDGTKTALPITSPLYIDANHDVASATQFLAAGASTPVDVATLLPSGWSLSAVHAMSNNGIIVGLARNSNDSFGTVRGFMLKPQLGSISGQVLRGSAPNTAFRPAHAAAGITVTTVGRTATGSAVRTSDVTDSSGRYTLDTPPGTYTVTFPAGVCASVPGKSCVRSAKVTVSAAKSPVLDAVALAALLRATLTLAPKVVTLPFDKKTSATEPKQIAATLTVKNIGVRNAESVRAPALLTRSYNAANVVRVPQIPVTQTAGPVIGGKRTAAIGTLAPGRAKVVTYTLRASGDGVYDIEALVIGSQPLLGRVATTGKATLKIGAPMLVMHLAFGRGAKGATGRTLIQAGTAFTIAATLENRSYTKELFVHPPKVALDGNAAGGVFVAAGDPINNPASPTALQISQYFTIAPRKTVKAEILVRTSRTSADVQDALGSSRGGTHATVTVSEPAVNEVTDDDSVGKAVPANEVFTTGETTYQIGLDDASMRAEPEPKTFLGYALAITNGTMGALWNLTIGGAISLFDGLKSIATSGVLLRLPRSIINYLEAEAALWNSIREGPTKGEFFGYFNSLLTEVYVHATGVHNSVSGLIRSADAALTAHLNTIADDYESGDWRGAVTELSKEGTEAVGTLVLGTGALTRWKPAVEAYEAQKAALFAKFGEVLDAARGKLFIGAAEAISTLAEAAPGYEFNFSDMANYYGLSESQVTWLLNFCKEHKIVVTLRSRAAESLAWLKKAAVLKPEQIKIKTVAWLDAKWLGYGEQNIGRVIIRPKSFLPSESKLIANMRRAGLGPKDAEYQEALTRLADRLHELENPAEGYAAFIEKANREKSMTLRWNLEENAVNPDYVPNGYTEYGFRLAQDAESGSGNLVVQFKIGKTWRSVTGDVDLLSMMGADGTPLSQAARVALYRLIAKGPLGLLHPAADTWTQLTKVGGKIVDTVFDFEKKINEFKRGGTAAQFAPDRIVRAVTFNEDFTEFTNPEAYKVWWNGGYNQVAGKPMPVP